MSRLLEVNPRAVRVGVLADFQALLSQESAVDDEQFQHVIGRAVEALEMSDEDLADNIKVSRPTINRWKNGRNLPHPLMRRPIIAWLNQQVTAKLRLLSRLEGGATQPRRTRVRAAGAGAALRAKPMRAVGKMRG